MIGNRDHAERAVCSPLGAQGGVNRGTELIA